MGQGSSPPSSLDLFGWRLEGVGLRTRESTLVLPEAVVGKRGSKLGLCARVSLEERNGHVLPN